MVEKLDTEESEDGGGVNGLSQSLHESKGNKLHLSQSMRPKDNYLMASHMTQMDFWKKHDDNLSDIAEGVEYVKSADLLAAPSKPHPETTEQLDRPLRLASLIASLLFLVFIALLGIGYGVWDLHIRMQALELSQ